MRAFRNKSRVLFSVWVSHMMVYRAEIVIWMLTGLVPLIMLAVWIGKAQADGGTVNGMTQADFAAYFLAAWLTQQMLPAWCSWDLDRQIRLGELSPKLLRPMDVFWEHFYSHAGERVIRMPLVIVIVLAGTLIIPGTRLTTDVWHVLAYIPCVIGAALIRFLIAYCIGLMSFWWDQAVALDEMYFTIAAFLTGAFAPLSLYPAAARAIIEWTPFPYMVYYPVRVLNGTADAAEVARVLGVILLWIVLLAGLEQLLWRRGLRRYGAVGA